MARAIVRVSQDTRRSGSGYANGYGNMDYLALVRRAVEEDARCAGVVNPADNFNALFIKDEVEVEAARSYDSR